MRKIIKNRFIHLFLALITVLSIVPIFPTMAAEDYSNGGWNQVKNQSTIVNSNGGTVGTVYPGEGVTILYFSGNNAYIEYSAQNKPKRGFINVSNLVYSGTYTHSAVGRITSSSSTYYSPNTTHYAGSVSSGEYVAVLCKTTNWSYIEYNISGGKRKRAFIPSSSLYCYSENNVRKYFYHENELGLIYPDITSDKTVYAGPDPNAYPAIGTVYVSDNTEVGSYMYFKDGSGRVMHYVGYPTSSGIKYGYIYRN